VDCIGGLHALAVSQLARAHRGVFVLGCPPHRCRSREGTELALGRLLQGREPELKQPLDARQVRFASGGAADLAALTGEFERFLRERGTREERAGWFGGARRSARGLALAAAVSAVVLVAVAATSQLPAGATPASGALRLAWRLPGQSWLDCRPLTADQIARLPAHMRRTQDCRTVYLSYRLRAWIDGRLAVDRGISPLGARGDRPLYVEEDLALAPGRHDVRVEFTPRDDPRHVGRTLEFGAPVEVTAGRARLLTLDARNTRLLAR
jgi:hypothetical protein